MVAAFYGFKQGSNSARLFKPILENIPSFFDVDNKPSLGVKLEQKHTTTKDNLESSSEGGGVETGKFSTIPIAEYDEHWQDRQNNLITHLKTEQLAIKQCDVKDKFCLGKAKFQLRISYIIAERKNGLVIVDQHAVYERIVYEKMKQVQL